VRVVERLGGLEHDVTGEGDRDPDLLGLVVVPERAQVLAVHVLHRDEEVVAVAPEVEDLRDVRVREARRDLRLVDEHLHEGLVVGVVGQDPLDGHRALEAVRAREPRVEHLGHPPDVDALEELVLAEDFRLSRHGEDDTRGTKKGPSRDTRVKRTSPRLSPPRERGQTRTCALREPTEVEPTVSHRG
jgi:hypothetical protein